MLKHISILSLLILFSTHSICLAQEDSTLAEEAPLSSDAKIQKIKIENKSKILKAINRQIYNPSNDSLMREYVRNSNAIRKMMGKPTQDVDINDKKALSQFMQDDIGLQKEIIQVQLPEKKEKSARPNAADLLK